MARHHAPMLKAQALPESAAGILTPATSAGAEFGLSVLVQKMTDVRKHGGLCATRGADVQSKDTIAGSPQADDPWERERPSARGESNSYPSQRNSKQFSRLRFARKASGASGRFFAAQTPGHRLAWRRGAQQKTVDKWPTIRLASRSSLPSAGVECAAERRRIKRQSKNAL